MIPYSGILESLGLVQVFENIVEFSRKSMRNWNTNLTSCRKCLANVDIRRGIFQGGSFSPLLFVNCMLLLTQILRKKVRVYLERWRKVEPLFVHG